MKKIICTIIIITLLLTLIPMVNGYVVNYEPEIKPKTRSVEPSDNTTVTNPFARGGSQNIVRAINNSFYYFWHNTTDAWCSVVTKDGENLSAGDPIELVGENGIIQVIGVNDFVTGLAVTTNISRTEIYFTWSTVPLIGLPLLSTMHFAKCSDLENIDQSTAWKTINDAVGYDNFSSSMDSYMYGGLSIAVNSTSHPHIVWHEYNDYNSINYTTVKSNVWQTPISIAVNNSNYGRLWNSIIDVNQSDVLHIFWGNTSSATDMGWVNHTYCNSTTSDPMLRSSWTYDSSPILENINTTKFSQAIDRDNDIWLAGINETSDLQINILNGSTWLNGTGANITFTQVIENISLGADANGSVYLGYFETTNDDIRYAVSDDWFATSTKLADISHYGGVTIEKRSKYDKWSLGIGWIDYNGTLINGFNKIYFENITVNYNMVWWRYSPFIKNHEGYTGGHGIAVSGNYVHTVWTSQRNDFGGNNFCIYYRRSSDLGLTWGGDCLLSKFTTITGYNGYRPLIEVNQTNIHVAYTEALGSNFIVYLNSTDNGLTWSSTKRFGPSVSLGHSSIAVYNDQVHIVYRTTPLDDIYYVNSSDGGSTFVTPKIIMDATGTEAHTHPSISVDQYNVVVTAQFTDPVPDPDTSILRFTNSSDNGTTWTAVQTISAVYEAPESVIYSDVELRGTNIYVLFRRGAVGYWDELLFNKSTDNGVTWLTESISISNNSGVYDSFSPSLMVSTDGFLIDVVFNIDNDTNTYVMYNTSKDGGTTWLANSKTLLTFNSTMSPQLKAVVSLDRYTRSLLWCEYYSDTKVILRFLNNWGLNITNPRSNLTWYDDMWTQYWYTANNITGVYAWAVTTNSTTSNCTTYINSQTGYLRLIPHDPGYSWWFNVTITDEFETDWNNFTLTCIVSPPYPGDWHVIENQSKSDETLPIRGNITVYDGKTLTLDNITVEMNCTSDAEFYILVWGNLLWNNTTITINYTTYFYNFTIASNGSATITNSTIEFVYDGIRVQSSSVTINNSVIRFNYGDGFIIENSGPTITNNTIHSHTENGISVENATPTIAYNTIKYNEWSGIAINYSTVSGLSHNTISYNKVGIYIFNSTLTSDNNTIKRSRSIGIVIEINSVYLGEVETFINNLVQLTVHNLSTAQLTDSGFSSGSAFTKPSFEFVIEGTLTIVSTPISTYKNNIFYLYNGSVIVRNCSIATDNIYTAKLEWNSTVTLVNSTILDNYDFADSTNSTVTVQYYLNVYVFDNHGGVDNARINITQRNGTRIMTNGLTGTTGWYRDIILTEYITNASTKIFHTPHIIVVKNGTKVQNRTLVMDHTQTLIIDFSSRLTFNLLKNKWNLIGISKTLSVTYTARNLIDLGCSKVIYRDTNGVYKSYIYEDGKYYGEDFAINSYKSYFVFYTKSTPLVLSGSETRGAVTIALQKGYNMVAVPHAGISALDVIQEVDGAKNVLVKRNGVYKTFSVSSNPSSSFSLNENEGIYIFVNKQTTWVIK